MHSRRLSSILLCFAAAHALLKPSSFAQTAPATDKVSVKIKAVTDRRDAQYHVGETVTFDIKVTSENKEPAPKTVACVLSRDGWKPESAKQVALVDGKGTITGSLKEPGFLLLRVTVPGTSLSAMAGAAFDPLQIKPSLPAPDDFDAFWAAQKRMLAAVPAKAQLTEVPTTVPGAQAFDIKVDCIGAPVSGYFGKPKKTAPKSLPAILFVHGAGVRSSNLGSVFWTQQQGGMLTLDINAHGIENGKPPAFYTDLTNGALKDYRFVGRADREKNYFLGMFLRLIRAIDFLTAQPEWDGKTVIVYGSSQGGFQALVAGGLDERVTCICAGVPAGCDHTGIAVDRINGWPKLVTITDGKPVEAELQTARYFDAVNFATRAKVKGAALTVGFIDTTCPPTSVYAAYNALPVSKQMHTDVLSGHTNTPAASKFMQEAAYAHVRAMK